jgi:formylglycine-generating enzyme required for sulfatase activity
MFRQGSTVAWVLLAALGSLTLATAQESKEAGAKKQIAVELGGGVKLKMVLIPAGEFKMGSGESAEDTAAFFNKTEGLDYLKAESFEDEHPRHRVRITKPFYLGSFHITRGQFRQFVKDSGYKTDAENGERPGAWGWNSEKNWFEFGKDYSWRNPGFQQTDEHPMEDVSWNDAMAFCRWLSRNEGKTYRLPTEAEWEYACRAGTTTRYSSGDNPGARAKVGNVADATAKAQSPKQKYKITSDVATAPVGQFKPNAFGLYNMCGNTWEWCADWYDAKYYAKSPTDDPAGPDTGDFRVLRGGSWCFDVRGDERSSGTPDHRGFNSGFRVARTP